VAAERFIGRVGGVALVLGIGATALSATAWADDAPSDSASAPARTAARGARSAHQPPASPPRAAATERQKSPRHSPPSAATRIPIPEAHAQAQAETPGAGSLAVDPQIDWQDGILRGTLGATSTQPLLFSEVSAPSLGGKLGSDVNSNRVLFGPQGQFTYLPSAVALPDATTTEAFSIRVTENTPFDQAVTSIPLLGLLAAQGLQFLHRTPVLGDLLAPVIGASEVVAFTVNPAAEAAGRPTAFTYLMPSFDGTPISVNYFPSLDVSRGEVGSAPTVLMGPGLPGPGDTDPDNPFGQLLSATNQFGSLTPGIPLLRSDAVISPDGGPSYDGDGGYNVITWDPRGEYASGGVLQLDNPFFEGRDVSAIISWATSSSNPAQSQVRRDAGDPLIGMVGGSYGGTIQLTAAGIDPRIDAIVPQLAWNSLLSSLYPNGNQFKTAMGAGLALALTFTGARINPQIYSGVLTGSTIGLLTQTAQAALASSGPTALLTKLTAPTLLFQGMEDVLFGPSEAIANAQAILANPFGVPVKMVWFCGGHGTCLNPLNPNQDSLGFIDNLKWLDEYVAGRAPVDPIPTFQWYDQRGVHWSDDLLPFQPGFNSRIGYSAAGSGGPLAIFPLLGGSGPSPLNRMPYSIGNAGSAWNALNVKVSPPTGSQVVGAPQLSFQYSGLGISRTVYAQLVDDTTGRVLGNLVTPIPVTLDGRTHTVSIPMEDVAYTVAPGDTLTLQIAASAANLENFTSFGLIDITDIAIDLPIRAANDPRF
jgi:ABC-2 type transport system ATP-binding protein